MMTLDEMEAHGLIEHTGGGGGGQTQTGGGFFSRARQAIGNAISRIRLGG